MNRLQQICNRYYQIVESYNSPLSCGICSCCCYKSWQEVPFSPKSSIDRNCYLPPTKVLEAFMLSTVSPFWLLSTTTMSQTFVTAARNHTIMCTFAGIPVAWLPTYAYLYLHIMMISNLQSISGRIHTIIDSRIQCFSLYHKIAIVCNFFIIWDSSSKQHLNIGETSN